MAKESVSMNSLCGKTTGKNIFREAEKTRVQYNLKRDLLRCVTTDGGRNVCEEKLLVVQIYKGCENVRCLRPMVYSLCYSSVGTLLKIFKSFMCY